MPKLIICDDHIMFAEGLKKLLCTINSIESIDIFTQGNKVIEYLLNNPDTELLLLDINLPPGISGYEVAKIILKKNKELKIILFSALECSDYSTNLIDLGIKGYLSKSANFELFQSAINAVSDGLYFFGNKVFDDKQKLLKWVKSNQIISRHLTARELEVAKLMSSEKAYKQIADELCISPNTVENIRVRIFDKTGSKNRTEVALFLIRSGLLM